MTNTTSATSPWAKIIYPFRKDLISLPLPTVEKKVLGLKLRLCLAIALHSIVETDLGLEHKNYDKNVQYCSLLPVSFNY